MLNIHCIWIQYILEGGGDNNFKILFTEIKKNKN